MHTPLEPRSNNRACQHVHASLSDRSAICVSINSDGFNTACVAGSDFAGTVISCGASLLADSKDTSGPDHLHTGDSAMGLAPGCLGSSALADADTLVSLAPGVALAAAAALPTVVVTAEAAFALAALRPGQR